MTEFNPTIFVWGDRAGQGMWEMGHYRQHLNYVVFLAQLNPPILLADHPLMTIGPTELQQKVWLNDHAGVHNQLRIYANVGGVDLSQVDFEDPEEFQVWLDSHSIEHELIDRAFGI